MRQHRAVTFQTIAYRCNSMNKNDFKHVSYNPDTGLFFSIIDITKPIGTANADGYIVFRVNSKLYYAHRVAWFLCYGEIPSGVVDHINRVKSDNRLVNLRVVTQSENCQNRTAKGITKPKQTKKWAASIMVNRKRKHIGYFDTPEQAHQAYIEAKKIYHPTAPVS